MRRAAMANEGLALCALIAAGSGCLARTAGDGVDRVPRRAAATRALLCGPAASSERQGVALVADAGADEHGAAEALASPLAAACLARALEVARSTGECIAAARERRLQRLVVCRVLEYDPYDPVRLVVGLTVRDIAAGSHLDADEAAALGRSFGAGTESVRAPRRPAETTVSVDLGARAAGWFHAYAREQGMGATDTDLLEAEVLLRDPARFFPFAARHIAAQVPRVETGAVEPSAGGRSALHAGETRPEVAGTVRLPSSRSLGVPDDLR